MKKSIKKAIAVVSMLAMSFVVVFAAGCTKKAAEGEAVDISALNADTYNVTEVKKDADGNYIVAAHAKGYSGDKDIQLAITFDSTASKVLKVEVVDHAETDGIGAAITEEDFLKQFEGIALPVSTAGSVPENPAAPAESAPEAPGSTLGSTASDKAYVDGTYTAEAPEFSHGYKDVVTVVISGGKIASVDYNPLAEEGGDKRLESENGEYIMTEDGPLWHEQSNSFGEYVVANQGTDGLGLNDEGKTDAIAGVSIALGGAVDLVNDCLAQASGTAAPAPAYADGTYTAEAPEFSHGYKDVVTVVISGGKIASVDYNPLAEEGGDKRLESENGEYIMTEDGPLWHEQSNSFGEYVVANQGTDGLGLNDEGKTDAIAGVSIALGGAVDLVNDCLAQASGSGSTATLVDGTYTAEAPEFSHGYKDVVTIVVSGGKITSVDYNPLAEEGGDKRLESENGEYIMTEDGPLWHEQSNSFGDYVVAHQGTDGLALNDEGKTDAIAGVSIALGGAADLVNDCIAQASGSSVADPAVAMADGTYTAEAPEFSHGYKDVVTIVVSGGKITSVDYNPLAEEGGDKRLESENGEYIMTEDGPLWHEQSNSFGDYVVAHQGTEGLVLNDEGKTDAIAGVSIALGGAADLVNDCIAQAVAAAGGSVPEQDEPAAPEVNAATFDAISGATVSSKAVARAINNAYYFLIDNVVK